MIDKGVFGLEKNLIKIIKYDFTATYEVWNFDECFNILKDVKYFVADPLKRTNFAPTDDYRVILPLNETTQKIDAACDVQGMLTLPLKENIILPILKVVIPINGM